MGKSRPLFVYFSPFLITISMIQIEKSLDGVLGIQTRGHRMVGADNTMELLNQRIKPTHLYVDFNCITFYCVLALRTYSPRFLTIHNIFSIFLLIRLAGVIKAIVIVWPLPRYTQPRSVENHN